MLKKKKLRLPHTLSFLSNKQNFEKHLPAFSGVFMDIEKIRRPQISIVFASKTGNGKFLAQETFSKAKKMGFAADLIDINDFESSQIKLISNLIFICSTHEEGGVPPSAFEFYAFINSSYAPKLTQIAFAVLALGDKTYVHFCKAGRFFDDRFEQLGAQRIFPRTDCDLDFEDDAEQWINGVLTKFAETTGLNKLSFYNRDVIAFSPANKNFPQQILLKSKYCMNIFPSEKETYHMIFDSGGLEYKPGDSIVVYLNNNSTQVKELLAFIGATESERVETNKGEMCIFDALTNCYEITNASPDVIKSIDSLTNGCYYESLMQDVDGLKSFLYGKDIIDILDGFRVSISPQQLVSILRPLQPRYYSISSSPLKHPDEIHITVRAVRYKNSRAKQGACSTFLSDRLNPGDCALAYIQQNTGFKLPYNNSEPIIMIGPGTGIAPFISFIQHRSIQKAEGKNWLFYGDRNYSTDFLYRDELYNYVSSGILTKLSVAFSRDQTKEYVQDKIVQYSAEFYNWLQKGAYIYICGDKTHMWSDVHKTIINIIQREGNMNEIEANNYMLQLIRQNRYQTDVY